MTKPIFILGSPRSGTSIIGLALRNGAGIVGYNEGHILSIIPPLIETITNHYKDKNILKHSAIAIANVSQDSIESEIIKIFQAQYSALLPHEVWLDKTPGYQMIKAVPFILKMYPEARFIFAKRRGIENIISRLKKFPKPSFESHCIMWKSCMECWLESQQYLSENIYIEVDQIEILRQPQLVSESLAVLLGLNGSQTTKIEHIFKNKKPEYTGVNESLHTRAIQETGWTDKEIAIFRKHCEEVSKKFGYSESSSYFLENTN
ncbi:hypothetical protein PRNO82_01922 [Planktothrix rubescens]|nr:hypothetical protein PRNO82_01922 [Planktothrix rubescens]